MHTSICWNRRFNFKYNAWDHKLHMVMYPLDSFVKPINFFCAYRWSQMFRDSKVWGRRRVHSLFNYFQPKCKPWQVVQRWVSIDIIMWMSIGIRWAGSIGIRWAGSIDVGLAVSIDVGLEVSIDASLWRSIQISSRSVMIVIKLYLRVMAQISRLCFIL